MSHRATVRYLQFWYLDTEEPRRRTHPARAGGGGARPARAPPGPAAAPQRAALQPRVEGEQKRIIRRETSRNVNVRLAVTRKRVNSAPRQEHMQLGGRPADGLFEV